MSGQGWKYRFGIIKWISNWYITVEKGAKNTDIFVLHAFLGYDFVFEQH